RAKEPDEVGPETELGLCLLWSFKVGRREAKRWLRSSQSPTDIAKPLCDALHYRSAPDTQDRTQSVQNGMRRGASHDS
ncbi:hypothetical protein A234_27154, partial [Pseudomonas syringae pv. actinidiae ICMP 19101]